MTFLTRVRSVVDLEVLASRKGFVAVRECAWERLLSSVNSASAKVETQYFLLHFFNRNTRTCTSVFNCGLKYEEYSIPQST